MKPIYFPFTYISEPIAEALGACFKQLVVYQPSNQKVPEKMRHWARRGILDIRVPVKKDEKRLDAILKDYIAWANLHQGSEIGYLKDRGDTIPFFDKSSVSQIKADIKKRIEGTESPNMPDHLFSARLFLQIAQEFDIQSWEIDRQLQFCENRKQDLFKNLKGENDDSYKIGVVALKSEDRGSYMTGERMEAWSRLMLFDCLEQNHEISGLFITSSRAVFEHLADRVPSLEKLFSFATIPGGQNRSPQLKEQQDSLLQQLEILAQNDWTRSTQGLERIFTAQGGSKNFSLTLYLVPRESPQELFSRWILARSAEKVQKPRFINTLIGLVHPK